MGDMHTDNAARDGSTASNHEASESSHNILTRQVVFEERSHESGTPVAESFGRLGKAEAT